MLKFSVIVPVYNSEKYIDECLTSVLTQTYTNYELILVNDGSMDRSGEICDAYVRRYPEKIIVVHNHNQGPYLSRLHGIKLAVSDVIVFLDSDDCLRKDALELLNNAFLKYDCDMVMYNAQECYAFPSMPVILPFQDGALFEGKSKVDLYKKLIETRSMNSICLKAVRKECAVIPEYIPTSCRLMHGEDLVMSACFITSASKIRYINNGIYHYRKTLGSITYSYKSTLNTSLKTVHTLLDKFIEVWDIPDMIQTHNARKVSGWMDVLVFMLKLKSQISFQEKVNIMKNMATDPYFFLAYQNMDRFYLKNYYRFLAYLMYKKCYFAIIVLNTLKTAGASIKKKLCRSKHGG